MIVIIAKPLIINRPSEMQCFVNNCSQQTKRHNCAEFWFVVFAKMNIAISSVLHKMSLPEWSTPWASVWQIHLWAPSTKFHIWKSFFSSLVCGINIALG